MPSIKHPGWPWILLAALLWTEGLPAAGFKMLSGHVPAGLSQLPPQGRVPATNRISLVLGLPLHDTPTLETLLMDLYDPASTNHHKFLTPAEFTARFGPTETDYLAVQTFAQTNGLTIVHRYADRKILDVAGPVAAVENAFQIKLQTYRHPRESRTYCAPDREPVVAATLPVTDVSGLSDFARPQPRFRLAQPSVGVTAAVGSAPDGSSLLGENFRRAYVPGTPLTGAGQMVGIFALVGFFASDIAAYAAAAGGGRTNIPIQTILLDGVSGVPGYSPVVNASIEADIDIELAIAMAPGLAKVVVFEGSATYSYLPHILNAMVTNSAIKNLSCSFGWPGGPTATTENYFKQMQAQGQSFFNAAGDGDAFGSGTANDVNNLSQANYPASSTNITQVGGTTLAMNGAGLSYAAEIVWNTRATNAGSGTYAGSSGGISSNPIPYWQTNLNLTAAKGSPTNRNIPDVALAADDVYLYYYDGTSHVPGTVSGTSCAAPLWAGLMALVNQQAALGGRAAIGFINPAVYALGASNASYTNCFHDITNGDNTWPGSTNLFFAVPGYDLCTGLGTPNGSNFINALAGPPVLAPTAGALSCVVGGLITPPAQIFTLTNASSTNLTWSLLNTSLWLSVSVTNGLLATNTATNVTVSLTAAGKNLPAGIYAANLLFTNRATAATLNVPMQLQLVAPSGLAAAGAYGGPFNPATSIFPLTNSSATNLQWSLINNSAWISVSASNGTLAAGAITNLTFSLTSSANTNKAGSYLANLVFTNLVTAGTLAIPFQLQVLSPNGFTGVGAVGGPFTPAASTLLVTNSFAVPLVWSIINTTAWLNASPGNGTVATNTSTVVNFSLTAAASQLAAGIDPASLVFTNLTTASALVIPFQLQIGQQIVSNGGFETGPTGNNPWGWTLADLGQNGDFVDNGNATISSIIPHTGKNDFIFGQGSPNLAYLSQNLATIPRQTYLVSFWLTCPSGIANAGDDLFLVNWNTNAATTNTVFNRSFTTPFNWTNISLTLTATGTNTVLQFGAWNNPYYFGLDDIGVWPVPLPTVTSFSRTANGLALGWNAFTGVVYQVQSKTNLLQTNWLTVATNTALGNLMNVTNPVAADPRRFFRIRMQQP